MNINATLLVQAINFFIGYVIIRFVFLRPAMAEINREEQEAEYLTATIKKHEKELVALEERRKKQWMVSHHFFKQHKPDTQQKDLYIFKNITPAMVYPSYSTQELTTFADHLRTDLLGALRKHNDYL